MMANKTYDKLDPLFHNELEFRRTLWQCISSLTRTSSSSELLQFVKAETISRDVNGKRRVINIIAFTKEHTRI